VSSLRELLGDLEARGHAPAGTTAGAERVLRRESEKTPWYLTLLMGAGAWLATIFFLIGAGMLLDFGGGWPGWAVVAVVFLALGLGARRFSAHVFVAQFSLGLTLAGWSCGVVAGGELLDSDFVGFVASGVVLAIGVYLLHPDAAPRFFVSVAAFFHITFWFFVEFDGEAAILRNVPAILAVIGTGLLFARPGPSRALLPLGHACAVTLALSLPLLSMELSGRRELVPHWPSVLTLTLGLAILMHSLLEDAGPDLRRELLPTCLGAVVLLGLACWFGGPSLLAAIFLLVLGRASSLRTLQVLGLVALPAFLFLYYHDLGVPLLTKSGVVIASGASLLLLRRVLGKRPWAKEAA
jgi:hypothetical protein